MRLYLSLLIILMCGVGHAQPGSADPGRISTHATPRSNPMNPDGDDWVTSTGSLFTGPLDETEFELPYVRIPEYEAEPASDVQVSSTSCTMYDLIGDATNGAASTYYYYQDPDGIPDNGDELVFFRFRVARLHTNSVGLSMLIDTDQAFGFAPNTGYDPNAVVGNPGFELEISVTFDGGPDILVYDVDGVTNPTVVNATYPISTHLQSAYALNQDPDCSNRAPGFIDIYMPFSALGLSSTQQIRMVGAGSETTGSALGGNADDIAGVDGTAIASDDDQFIAAIGSYPPFTFGGSTNVAPACADATVSLDENSVNATLVHTVSASDPDGDALTYTITGGNTGTAFAINASGQISVNDASVLDFETTPSFTLTVRVSDGTLYDDAMITIDLNDLNESPVAGYGTVSLDENSVNGSAVYTVSASDPDGDALTYTITGGNTGTAFAINASGQITVNNSSALDFETTPSFNLTVRVSDGTLFDDAVITINLNDVNETPSASDATVALDENSANGAAVHAVSAADPDGDALTYTITGGNTGTAFAINASGQITVNNDAALDFETTPLFNLTVRVSDGTLFDDAVITINLNDINETPSASDATLALDENSANDAAVHAVSAADPDGDALTYTITGGNTGTAFAINGSGQITVNNSAALDFETTPSFNLTVRVSDGTLFDDAVITINLNDIDETSPEINEPPTASDATVSLDENSANGTAVHTVSAADPDGDALTYTITGGNTGTAFVINASGQITVSNTSALDFETTPSFNLTVRVSDGTLFGDAVITINLNDIDETSPEINEPPTASDATVSLDENSPTGTIVHTVFASDPDGDELTYAIVAGNGDNTFAISPSGVITVNSPARIDFETTSVFFITVRISDGQLSSEVSLTVNVIDINEPPSISDAVIKIPGDTPEGTVVYQVVVNDPDASDATVFSIESGNSGTAFLMGAYTGEVIVNNIQPLDETETLAYVLRIMVVDAGGLTATATLTIEIENVDEKKGIHPLKGFSPDGDGINDFWLIKGIEAFPDNEVKVFNRWGNLVYEARHYNNRDISWPGDSNGRLGGDDVPETTYYFLITVEGLEPITGYVIMK